jgi:hypothetical protein
MQSHQQQTVPADLHKCRQHSGLWLASNENNHADSATVVTLIPHSKTDNISNLVFQLPTSISKSKAVLDSW